MTKTGIDLLLLFNTLTVSLGYSSSWRRDRSGMNIGRQSRSRSDMTQNEMEELTRHLASVGLRDRKAFKQLYEMTSSTLYAIALRILEQESLAQDVTQEAYIKIWNNASSYQPDLASPKTWMATIVRNQALDHIRKTKHEVRQADPLEITEKIDKELLPLEKMSHSEESEQLSNCLKYLKQKQRQIIALAYFKGFSHEQLSNYTGHPLGTVKTNIRRGLELLRRCLES